jgi:hypothetical protein
MHFFLKGALHAGDCRIFILEDDGNEGPEHKPFKAVSMVAAIAHVVGDMSPHP